MTEPKVLIGIPSAGLIEPDFLACAMELERPPTSKVAIPSRVVTDAARNAVVDHALKNGFTHVLFIDDDILFPRNLLTRLLALSTEHPKLAGITGLHFARHAPHHPLAFNRKGKEPLFIPIETFDKGLLEVDAISTGATIFPCWAFEKVGFPWFEYLYIGPNRMTEDLAFCLKAGDQGLKFGVDTDLQLGHLANRFIVNRKSYEAARQPRT